MRNIVKAAVLSGAAALTLASPASGAVTIGSNLEAAPSINLVCGQLCTNVLTTLPSTSTAPGGIVATSDGVVVRWRIKLGSETAPVALRIVRFGATPGMGTGAGTAPTVTPAANKISTFDVRLPIQAGDSIGIDCCEDPVPQALASVAGAEFVVWNPALQDGDTSPAPPPYPGRELLINADIEPDADADGFGDETQDGCPTDVSTQTDCDPPETTITKDAPRKVHKPKVKFKFTSDEAEGYFQCRFKRRPLRAWRSCESPEKFRQLRDGKQTFLVRAIDAAGNYDPTPAKDRFKIVG